MYWVVSRGQDGDKYDAETKTEQRPAELEKIYLNDEEIHYESTIDANLSMYKRTMDSNLSKSTATMRISRGVDKGREYRLCCRKPLASAFIANHLAHGVSADGRESRIRLY